MALMIGHSVCPLVGAQGPTPPSELGSSPLGTPQGLTGHGSAHASNICSNAVEGQLLQHGEHLVPCLKERARSEAGRPQKWS